MNKQEIHKAIQFAMNDGFQRGKLEAEKKVLNLFEKYDFIDKEIYEKEIGGNEK